jgi:hypothetical protein
MQAPLENVFFQSSDPFAESGGLPRAHFAEHGNALTQFRLAKLQLAAHDAVQSLLVADEKCAPPAEKLLMMQRTNDLFLQCKVCQLGIDVVQRTNTCFLYCMCRAWKTQSSWLVRFSHQAQATKIE